MRKLIETTQENSIVCDNPNCDFVIPYSESVEANMKMYIDEPCPKCQENLLTMQDYVQSLKLKKAIDFVNKWFSWTTIFMSKKKQTTNVEVHVHEGVKITRRKS